MLCKQREPSSSQKNGNFLNLCLWSCSRNKTMCSLRLCEMIPWSYSRVKSRALVVMGVSIVCLYQCVTLFCVGIRGGACVCVCVCFRQLWRKPLPVWRWRLLIGLGGRRPSRLSVSLQFHQWALPLFSSPLPFVLSGLPTPVSVLQHLHPLLMSLALQVQLIWGQQKEEVQLQKQWCPPAPIYMLNLWLLCIWLSVLVLWH